MAAGGGGTGRRERPEVVVVGRGRKERLLDQIWKMRKRAWVCGWLGFCFLRRGSAVG